MSSQIELIATSLALVIETYCSVTDTLVIKILNFDLTVEPLKNLYNYE